MIHRLLILIYLAPSLSLCAQNLVPNGSFEDTLCIENGFDIPFYTPFLHWFNPNNATPDELTSAQENVPCYFTSIYSPSLLAAGEWQLPKDGQHMAGLWCGNDLNTTRDLLEVELLEPLVADSEYCFSMYVSLGNQQNLAIDRIGGFFSMDSVYNESWPGDFELPYHLTSPEGVFLTDTTEWMLIEGVYQAQGGERFLVIGNSFDDTETNYLEVDGWGNGWDVAYYFVDEVKLTLCSALGHEEFDSDFVDVRQTSGGTQLLLSAPIGTTWTLYDLAGKKVNEQKSNAEQIIFDLSRSFGMYLVHWSYGSHSGAKRIVVGP